MSMRYRSAGFKGYSVKFSPFSDRLLAAATSANFGLVGNGKLCVLNTHSGPEGLIPRQQYDTQDGLFDLTWSEIHENQLATASGDGSVKLWDITLNGYPVAKWHEHKREVMSVEWNYTSKSTFLSSSWDGSAKLWSPNAPQSLRTFAEHTGCVYTAAWSPRSPDQFATCSEDKTVKLWSVNEPSAKSLITFGGHMDQVISLDWNKYMPNQFVTSSVDRTIKLWDVRNPRGQVSMFGPFEFSVRRVKFSPFSPNFIATAGYDMSASVWDVRNGSVVYVHGAHKEFVFGVDWSLFHPGQIATCSWDEYIDIFSVPIPQN
ncbi:peroxisomal targeting signal 2 receptor [Coemansia sp. RSA 1813]|nr:peroxisomal targeting signal 2 receptor [Coemansia sp. RSA 1646]KAJ1770533.1 peroxisomal targeting signal 2 receptor [Coemansia sp. RSA 1843]KAJ2092929.1 peroxisomal targeting signal 2 receptor [Coemansia sp. RSA 986]KAJ2216250.1 peroxisomal targeting signal 2 receptor [Coemansia sp. RSA 487]KAJ2570577.1 peroxisomal targeting signal 2 receptor [Coemansia sp. RSA 1813]